MNASIDGRYSRQVLFGPIGEAGQDRLLKSRVTLIGCGALGTAIANNLVRSGVGFLRICDRDFVELNNLQRQVLFDEDDVRNNMPKAAAAAEKLRRINSGVEVEPVIADVNFTNIESLLEGADLAMDGTDNFETRFLLNDACVKAGLPWVYGGCVGSYGVVMAVVPGETPCLRCAFESPPPAGFSPSCDTAGVLNGVAGIVASWQCTEALKILTGNRKALPSGILNLDVWTNDVHRFKVGRNPQCRSCVKREFEFLEAREGMQLTSLCGRNAIQIVQRGRDRVDFAEMEKKLAPIGRVNFNRFLFRADIDGHEITLFPDGRAIIKGTADPAVAKTVYSRYIGT